MFVNKLFALKTRNVFIGLTLLLTLVIFISLNTRMSSRLLSIDYKVIGRVQGVFFRKYTKRKANELGLKGWVENAADGSVVGTIQGQPPQIEIMKTWLQTKGSPASRIDVCHFTNERIINDLEFSDFQVRH